MRYVIAVGGNALREERVLNKLSRLVARLHGGGDEVIITHGNGPQVGELAMLEDKSLSALTAQTEAEIGLVMENKLAAASASKLKIATVLTRVLVDANDRQFSNPSKPIGRFYSEKPRQRHGLVFRKMIGGYRRIVPSPMPREIMEKDLIVDLLRKGYVVIAAGGGGIPLVKRGKELRYVEAVLDKDRSSALLAIRLKADRLIILTNVDGAYTDYKKPGQRLIRQISAEKLASYMKMGYFEHGSMGPKVEACIEFVRKTGKKATIGHLEKPEDAFAGRNCTTVNEK